MGIYFKRITIIGVGLIGGSLARVFKEKGLAGEIYGIGRSEENLAKAKSLGLIDHYFIETFEIPPLVKEGKGGIYSAVRDSELVVLSSPVGTFLRIVKNISPHLSKGTIITDVGSVKGNLVREIEDVLPEGVSFVGGHPIAGKESSGIVAASGDLFKGEKCILTPTDKTDKEALRVMRYIWEEAGSEVVFMDPDLHDKVFGVVSHLPHVIAYALINTVARMDFEGADPFSLSGRSFKDLTRIASSPPELWGDICLYNRGNLLNAIDNFVVVLKTLREYLEKRNGEGLLREFEKAKRIKENL